MENDDNTVFFKPSFREKMRANPIMYFFAFIVILCIIGFIFTNAVNFIFIGWLSFLICADEYTKKIKRDLRMHFFAVLVLSAIPMLYFVLVLFVPVLLPSRTVLQYPFQKAYLGLYQNIKEPEWFPDFFGDVKSDYRFEYFPGIIQADGYYSVRFKTTPQNAEKYKKEFEDKVQYVMTIKRGHFEADGIEIKDSETTTVKIDKEFWADCTDAKAYVLYDDFDWNHPDSAAVIVDTVTGKIQLLQNG